MRETPPVAYLVIVNEAVWTAGRVSAIKVEEDTPVTTAEPLVTTRPVVPEVNTVTFEVI